MPAILLAGARVERLIAGFLLGYRDRTRAAYLADLCDFGAWCDDVGIGLLSVHRTHVEAYVRHLEHAGRSRATVARRLATLAGFYRYAVQERTLPHSPVTHVRRPSVARDSQTLGLDREEAVRFRDAAEAASAGDHALACLLTLNGLRVSEACTADVADLRVERAHRVLAVIGKGGDRTLVPLAPRTVRAVEGALGGRADGPLLMSSSGDRLDRHDAARIVARVAHRAGLVKHITPHSLRHTMVTLALDAGVSLRDVQDAARHADPRTTRRYDTELGMPSTATPPTPWQPSLPRCSPRPRWTPDHRCPSCADLVRTVVGGSFAASDRRLMGLSTPPWIGPLRGSDLVAPPRRPPSIFQVDDFCSRFRQDCRWPGSSPTILKPAVSLDATDPGGRDAVTADDHASDSNAGKETDFALTMAAKFRSAARAADDLAARCRDVARWYAEQVDPELASDVDASAPSIAQAFQEVYQQGHSILAELYERRTASDPSLDQQAAAGIELAVAPSPCRRCPRDLLWTRDEAGKFLPLDPQPLPALAIPAHQRWLPDHDAPRDNNQPPRMRRAREHTEGYAYRRHTCPEPA